MTRAIGWILVCVSGAVLGLTFPVKGMAPLAPGLIPVFGVGFALAFLGAQAVLLHLLRSSRGWGLWSALAALGMLAAWALRALDVFGSFAAAGISYPRHILCSGACAAGLALGIAMIRYWVQPGEDSSIPE